MKTKLIGVLIVLYVIGMGQGLITHNETLLVSLVWTGAAGFGVAFLLHFKKNNTTTQSL